MSGVAAQLLPVKLTDLDARDYLKSLAMTEDPTEVHGMDGAALWRIDDDHFVLLVCKTPEHGEHKGPELLRTVLPRDWQVFYTAANPAEEFEAHHYGPVDA
jgi:hypothetical protein